MLIARRDPCTSTGRLPRLERRDLRFLRFLGVHNCPGDCVYRL